MKILPMVPLHLLLNSNPMQRNSAEELSIPHISLHYLLVLNGVSKTTQNLYFSKSRPDFPRKSGGLYCIEDIEIQKPSLPKAKDFFLLSFSHGRASMVGGLSENLCANENVTMKQIIFAADDPISKKIHLQN